MIPTKPDPSAALASSLALARALIRYGSLGDHDDVLAKLNVSRQDLRALEADDEIAAAIETRRDACTATPWRLEHPDERTREAMAAVLEPHLPKLMRSAWSSLLYGISVVEIVYSERPREAPRMRYGIAQTYHPPFEWFRVEADGTLYWRDTMEAAEAPKFFGFVRDGSLRKPMGEALLAKAWWPWWFRTHGWKFWARHLEQTAIPLVYGRTAGNVEQMLALIQQISTGPVVAINDSDTIEALDPPGNSPNKFQDFETACVRRIQRLILGQTLTSGTDGGSGNRALGEVHDRVRDEKRRADVDFVTECMQRVVDALAALNGIAEPPAFVMQDDHGLEAERADRDVKLTNAGILRFTDTYLAEKYGLAPDDFTVPERAPEPPAMAPEPAPVPASLAASPARFTPEQQVIEDEVARITAGLASPVRKAALLSAIRGADTPEDLARRLAVAFVDEADADFRTALERAIIGGGIIGAAHAEADR